MGHTASPIFPSPAVEITAELHLPRLSQFSDSGYSLLLYSWVPLSPLRMHIQQPKNVKRKSGEWLSLAFGEKRKEQLWPVPMALCWLRESHPTKGMGHGVQFIHFGGRERLTGLVLTWIMMDHQERAQQNPQLNQTQRVSSGINVGQVLSSQSDLISI